MISSKPKEILDQAAANIDDRAAERDKDQERSMARAVSTFNALTGHVLSEHDGWAFMALLKWSRAYGGAYREDDYIDAASYTALAAECLVRQKESSSKEDTEQWYMIRNKNKGSFWRSGVGWITDNSGATRYKEGQVGVGSGEELVSVDTEKAATNTEHKMYAIRNKETGEFFSLASGWVEHIQEATPYSEGYYITEDEELVPLS